MKGSIFGWVCLLSIIFGSVFALIYFSEDTKLSKTIVDRSAYIVNVIDKAELTRKTINPSIELAAIRSAYDLGKTSGGIETWSKGNPQPEILMGNLRAEIERKLPHKYVGYYIDVTQKIDGIEITWSDPTVNVNGDNNLNSKTFNVNGKTGFTAKDTEINTQLDINHDFNMDIHSSYLRLLFAGMDIFEDKTLKINENIITELDIGNLIFNENKEYCLDRVSQLTPANGKYTLTDGIFKFSILCGIGNQKGLASFDSFDQNNLDIIAEKIKERFINDYGLDFEITMEKQSENKIISTITITDKTCVDDTGNIIENGYCLAPTKIDEIGITLPNGNQIPADYLQLIFKTETEI